MCFFAFGQAIFGRILDWIGPRLGSARSIAVWSIAMALRAFSKGVLSFGIFYAILGVADVNFICTNKE